MATKVDYLRTLAEQTARSITWDTEKWTEYLRTAGKLYKYPFEDQLLIHAQRPQATAVADYDVWNKRMGRYVRRGSNGIALLDETSEPVRIRYVFDITDTGRNENSKTPYLWQLGDEHFPLISKVFEAEYQVPVEEGIALQIKTAAFLLSDEHWNSFRSDILRIVDKSSLGDYDEDTIRNVFSSVVAASAAYAALSRCELYPDPIVTGADFRDIPLFNTQSAVNALGTAVNTVSSTILRRIETIVKAYEREKLRERSAEIEHKNHGTQHRSPELEGRPEQRSDVLPVGRGLASGDRGNSGGAGGAGQPTLREVQPPAEDVPEGESSPRLHGLSDDRDAGQAPEGRGGGSLEAHRSADAPDGGGSGRDRGAAPDGPAALGRAQEQRQGERGGDHLSGADLRLNDAAPSEGAGTQLSFFPTEAEQLQIIQEAESAQAAPFASSVPQEIIDDFLRFGSNTAKSRMHLIAALYPWHTPDTDWLTEKARETFSNILRREYHGGYGLIVDGEKYAAWYDDQGLRVCRGTSARYSPFAQTIPWNDVLERVWHLYGDGKFATNVEAVEAHGNECSEVALSLLYLYFDRSEKCREGKYLSSLDPYVGGGYTEEQARLAEALADKDKAYAIKEDLDAFMEAYDNDRSLLNWHYHKLPLIESRFASLLVSWDSVVPQAAAELTHNPFITEDELDAAISSGSNYEGGKKRIYDYFNVQPPHTQKDKADFLKDEFGTGGYSHALSGADSSMEDYDAKGLRFRKGDCPEVTISWPNTAKRIDTLIRMNRYLTPEEQAKEAEIRDAHYEPEESETLPGDDSDAPGDESFDVAVETPKHEAVIIGEEDHTLYLYASNGLSGELDLNGRKRQPEEALVVAAPAAYLSSDFMFANDVTFLKIGRDISAEDLTGTKEDQIAAMKKAAASIHSEPWEAYTRAKQDFQGGIVLLRVGNEYEILGEDAEKAADALGLSLSSRHTPDGRVPMCRFSMSDLYDNVRKLNEKWNVRAVDYKDENHEQRISEDYPSFFNLLLQGKKTGRTRVVYREVR